MSQSESNVRLNAAMLAVLVEVEQYLSQRGLGVKVWRKVVAVVALAKDGAA